MTLEDALNKILSNACPNNVIGEDHNTYYIETHCVAWMVEARCLGWDHEKQMAKYEIISMTPEPC